MNIKIDGPVSIKSIDPIWKTIVKDASIVIVSFFLGAFTTYYFTVQIEEKKKEEEKQAIAKIIYLDVLNKMKDQYTKAIKLKQESFFQRIIEEDKTLQASANDFLIYEASIKYIPQYQEQVIGVILAFYGGLKLMDGAVEFLNKAKDKETRKLLYDFILNKADGSIKRGKLIISYFEDDYNFGEIMKIKEVKEEIKKLHEKFIKLELNIEKPLKIKEDIIKNGEEIEQIVNPIDDINP